MIKIIFIFLLFTPFMANADGACYRECASWDTFCKSPEQIVATKCRLGVPVYHDQCKALGVPTRYLVRGGGSLVESMPCSGIDIKNNIKNEAKL